MSSARTGSIVPKLTLFPDTNLFIEAKDLKEIPWEEIASQEIRLLACPIVLEEIDEHKTSDRYRVRERAQKWNSEFKKLLIPRTLPLVLREKPPRVTLEILDPRSVGPSSGSLDLSKSDNKLIDWTVRFRDSNSTDDVRLLTEDTGPLGKAYEIGLSAIGMPTHWRRELGLSDDQKLIESLRQQVKLYQENYPKAVISILDDQDKKIPTLKHVAQPYRNLTGQEVEALIEELRLSDPPVEAAKLKSLHSTQQITSLGMRWVPPTDEEISKYLNHEYPAWIDETREVLWMLGTNLSVQSLIAKFTITLTNEGSRPAEGVKLTAKTSGHFQFLKDKTELSSVFVSPKVSHSPRPPMGQFVNQALAAFSAATQVAKWANFSTPDLDFVTKLPLFPAPKRDINAWYLEKEEGQSLYTTEKVFTCDLWRHREESFRLTFLLRFDDNLTTGSVGAIEIVLHADNLPEPAKRTLPLQIEVQHLDVLEEARKLLRLK